MLGDGRGNPVDHVEWVHVWLPTSGGQMARIITVVNCRLGLAHPELQRWYDACIHFSDVALLTCRDGVPNKWVADFSARFRKQHFPCLIELVKADEVDNPALVLEPEARRMSMLFDGQEAWPEPDEDEDLDEMSDADLIGAVDPYIERLATGRRAREIPDITTFLPAS